MTAEEAQTRAIKGIAKGLLKTISKMGISTIPSYCGAQIFEAVGLEHGLVERHFTGTPSRIGGIGTDGARPRGARPSRARLSRHDGDLLPLGGVYAWRDEGEYHQWNPETIALLQHAVRHGGYAVLRAVLAAGERGRGRGGRRCAGCCASACAEDARSRSRRSSRRPRSSSASRPARCRSARSRARRTRRSRSR